MTFKPTDDPIINNVMDRILKRHLQGMKKFKVTMADNPKTIDDWTEDTIEELIDALCYLVTLKSKYDKETLDLKREIDMLRDDLQIVNLESGRMMEKINKLGHNGKKKT